MDKKKLLHEILTNLDENWCGCIVDDGKAYTWTDSEIAADALTEILYDLGFEVQKLDNPKADYIRTDIIKDGLWYANFVEL